MARLPHIEHIDDAFQTLTLDVAGANIVLAHGSRGWRCASEPPAPAAAADTYQKATEAALIAAGIAAAINALIVDPAHAQIVAEHADALLTATHSTATAGGAEPIAFEAAAFYALNQTTIDWNNRWRNETTAGPAPSRLLDERYVLNDPLRNRQQFADSCVERAFRRVAAGEQVCIEHLPFERAPRASAGTYSPMEVAQRTGLGSVVGTGPGVCADLHDAHVAAGTGAGPTGLVVLAAAHRDPPETEAFRVWVCEHLLVNDGGGGGIADTRTLAVADVAEVAAGDGPDATLATRVLDAVSWHAPDVHRCGVAAFRQHGSRRDMGITARVPGPDDRDDRDDGYRIMAEAIKRSASIDDAWAQVSDPRRRELLDAAITAADLLDDDVVVEALSAQPPQCEPLIAGDDHSGFVGLWIEAFERALRLDVGHVTLWALAHDAKKALQDPSDRPHRRRYPAMETALGMHLRDSLDDGDFTQCVIDNLSDCFWVLAEERSQRSQSVVAWIDTLCEALRREIDHTTLADALAKARQPGTARP